MMWQWIVFFAVFRYSTDDSRSESHTASLESATSTAFNKPATDPATDQAPQQIALLAMDRQCGSCHHPDRSTNKAALAIFDLTDECWYCPLSTSQADQVRNRIKSSSFSEDERTAIIEVLKNLSE